MNTNQIKSIVTAELVNASNDYLRDIVTHGIHNLKNDFHGENNEEYSAFAKEFKSQAKELLVATSHEARDNDYCSCDRESGNFFG